MSVLGKRLHWIAIVVLMGCVLGSCEDDFNTIGADVIGDTNFEINKAYFDVSAQSRALKSVRTDGLPSYQLGRYEDPLYGVTSATIVSQLTLSSANPIFGKNTPENEDETVDSEEVKEVYLYIPFYSEDITDESQDENLPKEYRLDSIYGNQEAIFKLKVERSGFYLGDIDPDGEIADQKEYFSDEDFSSFTQELLFEGDVEISNKETLIFNEDDPSTTDVNEAETIAERIAPGIRVPLDINFFQTNLIDKEGSEELRNNGNFKNFLRGVYISTPDLQEHLLMLLNFTGAKITVNYEYKERDNDNNVTVEKASFELSMASFTQQGARVNNVVNTFVNETVDVSDNSRLFVKGGEGSFAEITLDLQNDPDGVLDVIRNGKGMLNEANLKFYIDREMLDNANVSLEPEQLYLYKLNDNGEVLDDYFIDANPNVAALLSEPFLNYGGKLVKGEDEKGIYYKLGITEHLKNVLKVENDENDSEEDKLEKEKERNVKLALTVTSNINLVQVMTGNPLTGDPVKIPSASTINPLGTVLIGSNVAPEDEDKKLQLEIFYTKLNQ